MQRLASAPLARMGRWEGLSVRFRELRGSDGERPDHLGPGVHESRVNRYSSLIEIIGSMAAARRAGTSTAASPAIAMVPITSAHVAQSSGETP